jgi:hypothetical protein
MSARHPERLLAQALHLARRDRYRPEQVNLRGAVSSAYYSLFHALVRSSCAQWIGSNAGEGVLRLAFARTYSHAEMQRASRAFSQGRGSLPALLVRALGASEVSDPLRKLADLFHRLQDDRHEADYDLSVRWRRADVLIRIVAVESSLDYLRRDRNARDLRVYLTSILVWNRISNR